jgi:hypothetical protein
MECLEKTKKLIADLDAWAEEHLDIAKVATDPPAPFEIDPLPASGDSKNRENSDSFLPPKLKYLATRMTLNKLAYKICTESHSPSNVSESQSLQYLEEAIEAANIIVQACLEIEQATSPSFDVCRTIGPLLSVFCAGPTAEMRNNARGLLERCGSRNTGLHSITSSV